ncbi:hypothetical protein MF408_01325 [Nocardioides sp. TF02-7]|nr:hypothetical protein MF408_01325 [Nocardioides sp. TF02-7]
MVRSRVQAARDRQHLRYAGRGWRLNAHVPSQVLKREWPVTPEAARLVDHHAYQGRLSARGAVRVMRVAWTIADLRSVRSGRDVRPGVDEVDAALRLRTGQPLDLRQFRGEATGAR